MNNSKNIKLVGKNIYLRPVQVSDATKEYVSWLNDPEINQYLESRFARHTLKGLKKHIKKVSRDKKFVFLAIVRKDSDKHIGNIKLSILDKNHKLAEIGIMIGDKGSWGHGFAGEVIDLLTDFAFKKLKLHKIIAGAYEGNIGSIKTFVKRGYIIEGAQKKHYFCNGRWMDKILMAKFNKA
ncbi:MAG: GNAT family protein [bacterium]|nr:GNAT family protein [bacterium]